MAGEITHTDTGVSRSGALSGLPDGIKDGVIRRDMDALAAALEISDGTAAVVSSMCLMKISTKEVQSGQPEYERCQDLWGAAARIVEQKAQLITPFAQAA